MWGRINMEFKECLRLLRKSNDLGQDKLAEALNISAKTISHWETGYTEPSISQLIQLADFFDVTLDELMGRSN